MDSVLSERMVIGIVTNLNTRFAVLPLRSDTVGDIRGIIKSYHMDLFPKWGEVDVNALEVELSDGRSRIADPLPLGHLFWMASQASVFAELIPSSTCDLPELPRPEAAGATEPNTVPEHSLQQNCNENLTPVLPETMGPVEGASTEHNHEKSASDLDNTGGTLGSDAVALEIEPKTKRKDIDERENGDSERDMRADADGSTADIIEPATKKHRISRGHPGLERPESETLPALESRLISGNIYEPTSSQELRPPVAEKEQEATLLTSNPTGGDAVVRSEEAVAAGHESSERDGARSSSQSDHPATEKMRSDSGSGILHPPEVSVTKTVMALESKPNSSSADLPASGGLLGWPGTEKAEEKPVSVADASAGSRSSESEAETGSLQEKLAERDEADEVEVVDLQPDRVLNLNAISESGSLQGPNRRKHFRHGNDLYCGTTSGGSTGEGITRGVDSGDECVDLQGNHSSRDCNNESDSDEASRSGSGPTENSASEYSDLNSSDGHSTPPSSDRPDSVDIGSSNDERDGSEELAPRENTPEQGVEAQQLRSDDSQRIRAAVQLARMATTTKGVNAVLGATAGRKGVKKDKGIAREEECELFNGQKLVVLGLAKVDSKQYPVQERNENGDPLMKDVISRQDVADQALGASRLSVRNRNIGAGEKLGKVLLTLEGKKATRKLGTSTAEEMSHEPAVGVKRLRKRSSTTLQESEEEECPVDRRDQTTGLEDPPSGDLPDSAGEEPVSKEHSGKNTSFENRDLPKRIILKRTSRQEVSLKRGKGLKSPNVKSSEGAVEKSGAAKRGVAKETARPGLGSSPPHVAILKKKGADHEGTAVVGHGDGPSELMQRIVTEIDPSSSSLVKKKARKEKKGGGLQGNKGELHVELNPKDVGKAGKGQLEDIEDGHRGSEEPSDLAARRESKDDEKGRESPLVLGGQESADVQLNGEPARKRKLKERRRLSFDVTENLRRSKKSGIGKDRDSRPDPGADASILASQDVDFESHGAQVSHCDVEEEDFIGDVPIPERGTGSVLNMDRAKMMPASLGEKMKKRSDKSKKVNKSNVAAEMEQLDDLAISRTAGGKDRELTLRKKKRKDLNLESPVEVEISNGDDLFGASQVDHEDQLAVPVAPEIVKKQDLKTSKSYARKKKLDSKEPSQQKEDVTKDKEGSGSKTSEPSPSETMGAETGKQLDLDGEESVPQKDGSQMKPASCKKRQTSSKKIGGDAKTKGSAKTPKRSKAEKSACDVVKLQEAAATVQCPHGCGKEWSKKTSAFFRHQKSCAFAHGSPSRR